MRNQETRDRLTRAVASLASDEGFQRWLTLRTQTALGRYSMQNQLLIAVQYEGATRVAGYRAWQQQHGRQVRKGERGIWILAPLRRVLVEEDPETGLTHRQTKVTGFKGVAVFDVSQTVGEDLPEYRISPVGYTAADWESPLCTVAQKMGLEVESGDTGGADGYFSPKERKIVLSRELEPAGTVATLVHELIHAQEEAEQRKMDRKAAEMVTELASCIICSELGLDTSYESGVYLLSFAQGDVTEVLKYLQAADRAAKKLEEALGLHQKDQALTVKEAVTA